MAAIGTISVTLQTVDRDETVYKTAAHNVTHTDVVALRRTLPKQAGQAPVRTALKAERGFPSLTVGEGEKPVTVSIACTVPPNVNLTDVGTYISLILTQSAATVAGMAQNGDIHLD